MADQSLRGGEAEIKLQVVAAREKAKVLARAKTEAASPSVRRHEPKTTKSGLVCLALTTKMRTAKVRTQIAIAVG
jgi:hypothetical protein